MSEKVFVYGTLRTGDCRHGVDTFVEMVAPKAYLTGFEMLDLGGFPGLIQFEGDDHTGLPLIRGEVHEYENLSVLDRIEGYRVSAPKQGLYDRIQVRATVPEHDDPERPGWVIMRRDHSCWVYVFNGEATYRSEEWAEYRKDRIVQSGDWFEHRGYYEKLEALGVQ